MDESLIAGYRRFRAETWPQQRARFQELAAQGQSPRAMVIACSDSRVDPQMVLGAGPGELFVVRNVANLVPPYGPDPAFHGTSAALEFAVRVLRVPNVVVMGHALCGGIRTLLEGAPEEASDFVVPWMRIARPARDRVLACEPVDEARQEALEQEAVRLSLANLMTFPWVREGVEAGRLRLHGCHFGVATGRLTVLGEDGAFAPVPPAP
jgi:carbonic anhydrase